MKSPNYFQSIVQGKKNLSNDLADAVGRILGLEGLEHDYLRGLVREAHAETDSERADARRNTLRIRADLAIARATIAQRRLLDAWYHTVVREMTTLADFDPEPSAIARRLHGLVSAPEVEASLGLLQDAGLLERDAAGSLVPAQPALLVGNEVDKTKARAFVTQNLAAWARVFSDLDPALSFGTVASFAIPDDRVPELIAMVRTFAKELAGMQMNAGAPTRILQMGVFLVPVCETAEEAKRKGPA